MNRTKLAVAALALLVFTIAAIPAVAQGVAFNATSLPRTVRAEGRTETMGEIVLTSTGAGTIKAGSNINILFAASITNTVAATNIACTSLAGAGAPSSANCNSAGAGGGANPYTVTQTGSQLTIGFPTADTVITAAGYTIVISQVRVDVKAISATTVIANLSGFSPTPTTNPLTFNQPSVTVGVILASLTVTVPRTTVFAKPNLATCVPNAAGAATQFQIRVAEKFAAALTTLVQETTFSANTDLNAAAVANASEIDVVLTGVPTGFKVSPVATSGATGLLVLNGGALVAAQNGNGSALTFKFPVTASDTSATEQIDLNFQLSNAAGIAPGSQGNITATVSIGPTDATSKPAIVTFNDPGVSGTVASLSDCVTNLLFPFVANTAGFNTGIALANTTADKTALPTGPNATAVDGTCKVVGYSALDASEKVATTGTIKTGTTCTFTLGDAGPICGGSTATLNGLTGYIIAQCNFLDAHGFAFIVDGFGTGVVTTTMGYVANIIGATRIASPSESLGH